MMFLVSVQVTNSSSDSSTDFWVNSCSFEKHWVTDDPEVLIQSWTCDENVFKPITLDPGEVYRKNIILYVPKKDQTGSVTFRLGFKRMSENGDVAEPLWSESVTMNVIVSEEMKAAAVPESVASAVSQAMVFQDPGVPIRVWPGDEFSISLTSNPSTGFLWKMTLPEGDGVVTFLGSEHVAPEEVMPGAPGQEVFKFRALTSGKTKAAFVYHRPWERKTAPPRKIFTILVQKN